MRSTRRRPRMSPNFPPVIIPAAITSVYVVMTLDCRDAGVEILDQRADRHVRDGRVDRHQELRDREKCEDHAGCRVVVSAHRATRSGHRRG